MKITRMKYSEITREDVKKELAALATKLGYFPRHQDLLNDDKSYIRNVMATNGWKIADLAQELGCTSAQASMGTWTHEKILAELQNICQEFGYLPDLDSIDKCYLKQAIYRSGCNIKHFQALLGLKSKTIWDDDKLIAALKEESDALGGFPTVECLKKKGRQDIIKAIEHSGNSIHHFATLLGYKPSQRPKGYWNDFENVKREIREAFPELIAQKKFPTQLMMVQAISSRIGNALAKNGGINVVATVMGCEPPSFHVASDGHFVSSSFEFIVDEFLWSRGIAHDVNGHIPGCGFDYDFKVRNNFVEIWGYETRPSSKIAIRYQEKRKIKEQTYANLGLSLISLESNMFNQPLDVVEGDLVRIFGSLGFDMSLKVSGYDVFNVKKSCGFWTDDVIIAEAKRIINELGCLPGISKLKTLGLGGFADAAKERFTFPALRKQLGLDCLRKSWSDDKIVDELRKLDNFTYSKLPKDLASAIMKRGGIEKFRKLL